ncbi:hypothetical protein M8J76_016841 [Diaphorina citri]|nr:hypothetical protein M8J76_016841 [Diaphorina citri]
MDSTTKDPSPNFKVNKSRAKSKSRELNSVVLLARMPNWYQELSNEQEHYVENLHNYLRTDALEVNSPQTAKFLDNLGIYPPLSVVKITHCLERSHYRPIMFLKYTAQLLSLRPKDNLRKHHAKLENLQYIKLGSDTQETNPYLAVPEILQRKRRIVYEHNKSVKEKRKQYVQLLRNINYKQDIITEMVKHELVCDANLKYQYQKGKQKFDILKRKFKTLEMDRKDIEVKLYPQETFTPRDLPYDTFEALAESKCKDKKKRSSRQLAETSPKPPEREQDFPSAENSIISSSLYSSGGALTQYVNKPRPGSAINYNKLFNKTNMEPRVDSAQEKIDTEDAEENADQMGPEVTVFNVESVVNAVRPGGGSRTFDGTDDGQAEQASRGEETGEPSRQQTMSWTTHQTDDDSDDELVSQQDNGGVIQEGTSNRKQSSMKTTSLQVNEDLDDATFSRELLFLNPKQHAKLATLPSLKDLPKLKIWYQRRMTPTEDKTGSFERPDEYELLKRLERIRNTQFTLPTITRGTVDRRALCTTLESIKAAFTREMKLKQIDLSRELFTLYNVHRLPHASDVTKFKRIFFAMFPNREKDILIN